MTTLFDQRQVWDIELYNVAQESREEGRQEGRLEGRLEGRQEGRKEGKQEGAQEERINLIKKMLKMASPADVSALTGIPQDEVERLANA